MSEYKNVKIQNFLETQIPEFLNVDNPLFKEFLEQYYISLEHPTGTVDLANNLVDYIKIKNFNNETFYTKNTPCILTEELSEFDATIHVNHTIGFPSKYGLLKINDEIITYTSKTEVTFEGCIRGFSGIEKLNIKDFYGDLNFSITNVELHAQNSEVENLNLKFFDELFQKFKYQFLPGFENREFVSGINLEILLSKATDFYSSKGTDTSYKILFKILYGEEVEIIKPQDYMLRPSDNSYFITKNILVEKISGELDPLDLKGYTLFQQNSDGLASASIYNIEIRPVKNKILYEISLDPDSFILDFQSTKKTKVIENSLLTDTSIVVDSTVEFPSSGEILVQSANFSAPFIIQYSEKTLNQFLGVVNNKINLSVNDVIIENNFAYCTVDNSTANFRLINVVEDLDYSNTFGMKVGDRIKVSTFGLNLNDDIRFSNWLYNIPSSHKIKSLNSTNEENTWRIEFFDSVSFKLDDLLRLKNTNNSDDLGNIVTVGTVIDNTMIEVFSEEDISDKDLVSRVISKCNLLRYPESNYITSNIQSTYIDNDKTNFYVASSGLPDYTVFADNRKILVSTPNNLDSSSETTTILDTNIKHKFYTGEQIYLTPSENLGISTGSYFITALGNYVDSQQISLSYSRNDVFSQKYIQVSYGATGEFVRLDYENKIVEHQKLLRKFSLDPDKCYQLTPELRETNNRPIGILLNGVEIYSPTLYDENIYYGRLSNIEILSSGNDYDVINSPDLTIDDVNGINAKAHLNISGSLKQVRIINPGTGYEKNLKLSFTGGNGSGVLITPNVIKTRISSGFRGDGVGVNPTSNSITFINSHNFKDGEEIEYISNSNIEIEYLDPVSGLVRKLPTNSYYFVGVISDTVIKLYRTPEDAAKKIKEINLTTSPSFGYHYFRTLESRYVLVDVLVENSGENYSNKKVIISSDLDVTQNQNGIDIIDDVIVAKNHNFKDKDLVVYKTTGTAISGLSTTSKYFIKVLDENRFNLVLAENENGITEDSFIKNKIVRLETIGVGTHTFAYPPIEIKVEGYPDNSEENYILPTLEPVVTGSIESVFIEKYGEKYGTSNIVNFHRRPLLNIGEITSEAILKPVILNGIIIDIQILNYGNGYGKGTDLIITGSGKFADLYPVVENGRISSIVIINGGIGYDEKTNIRVQRRGKNAKLLANVFQWKINQVEKNKFLLGSSDEGILVPSKNQQTGLQFIHFYPPTVFRKKINDNIDNENKEEVKVIESPILGWSYDGHPIYGPYQKIDNSIQRIKSSYIKSVERNVNIRPSGIDYPDGFFIQDFSFNSQNGDLDEYNGKFIKNSDFPNGTYAYFLTIDIDSNKTPVFEYPYVISEKFKDCPLIENYNPKYNQDLNLNDLGLIRNTSPYYLNSENSYYEAIDNIEDKFKQEFIVKSISRSGIDSISVYNSGDNYQIGDILNFRNNINDGTGIYASISKLNGKEVSSINLGITTIFPVTFVKDGNFITGISDNYLPFENEDIISISNLSSTKYKFIEGIKRIYVDENIVGLITNIGTLISTGDITKIYLNDVNGFEVDDFIQIDAEILKILEILPIKSALRVRRLSNIGIHSAGTSQVKLLPRKFRFNNNINDFYSKLNVTKYFDAENVVGIGTTYLLDDNRIINIPEKSIYIPNHSFFTGQPLTYGPGFGGVNLYVSNSPGSSSFQLGTGQTVYAINQGKDFLGISTLGFTTSVGIGTTLGSLYFNSVIPIVGSAHSFTTQYSKITGKVENYSLTITTETPHELLDNDFIGLNVTPEVTQTVKFIYDSIIRKVTTEKISFNAVNIETTSSEILIDDTTLKTGDKVVYYNNGNSTITNLQNNKAYFVVNETPGKIKLSNYYRDSLEGIYIELSSSGSGTHKLAKINPAIKVTKGNYINFDLTDESMAELELKIYKDLNFDKELEDYNYILNNSNFIRTSLNVYPRELYYKFTSSSELITEDTEVEGYNSIEIEDSTYNNEYSINVLSNNSFKINLNGRTKDLNFDSEQFRNIIYTTTSKNTSGPIHQIKINSKGNGYSRLPKLSSILTENGKNAIIQTNSNKIGKISSVERVKDGFDYPTDKTLVPVLSTPALIQIENISRIDYVGIVSGGRGYNTPPSLKILGNDKIKLQSKIQGSSVVEVEVIENTNDLSFPLPIIPTRNSNGYSIDDISVSGSLVTLELLNSNFQIYPLINVGYGDTNIEFPFNIGDQIFIERCRVISSEVDLNGVPLQKDNYNSSDYNYTFFTVVGVNTSNYTITYDMGGLSDNLGEYNSDLGYGYVVNRKDMAEFEMVLNDDLGYLSKETVFGYNETGSNTFSATVMENGWENVTNELRVSNVKGNLKIGDTLKGSNSSLSGKVTKVDIFNLKTSLGIKRDKLNDFGDRVGFLNDFQQRISDNNYYQKFSYSIKGNVPYNIWKEPINSIVHPSGFKEFSDLSINSVPSSNMKVTTNSSLDLIVNIDNTQSLYKKNNFAMVTEEEIFEDGSIERVAFEEGISLKPYTFSKTNKVILIDDISPEFNGTANIEIIANKPVTFISTDLYRLGVSTDGLSIGDKIGFSTYHFYPDSTYILEIGPGYIGVGSETPHRLYSINGISTSVTENLNFYRRILGDIIVGLSSFRLTNNDFPLFYREFDASNGISTSINLSNNSIILENHNFQTGQKIMYNFDLSGTQTEDTNKIGIALTSEVEGTKDIIIAVGGGIGSAIYENGYNVAISTSITGISSSVTPNFSGQQSVFWSFNEPYIPVKTTTGSGINAKFSVFIVYNSSTGQPISTSIILRDGGKGYRIGDTVSIAGTYIGGSTPTNDLSFKVSRVSSTRILGQANQIYNNVPGNTVVGYGSQAIFDVTRDSFGDIANVFVVNGGSNYELQTNISIAGTYIGGSTPLDNLLISPTVLGTDKLPNELYVDKISNNSFKVSGTPTGNILDITSLGIGTQSFSLDNANASSIIAIDNVIQTPVTFKNLKINLAQNVGINSSVIYIQSGIGSISSNDILKIKDEYMTIKNIGVDGENSLLVNRAVLGTEKTTHTTSDKINIYSGNYNIVNGVIYFTSPPYGPTGLSGLEIKSSFSGRVFSRRFDPFIPNDKNLIFDDISNQFTGIAATQFVLKSNENSVVGIFTNTNSITASSSGIDINNNPIILINNVFQIGGTDYIIDSPGQNTIKFESGVPLGGRITKVGYTTGLGYIPLVGASATVSVSVAGTISNVYLTGFGRGYRTAPIVSIASTIGVGASIISTIGTGGTVTSLTIINPGVGYTNSILPEVRIDIPQNYYNLELTYDNGITGTGQGAKASVIVGNGSSIIEFNLDESGTGYKVGDILTATGISTIPNFANFSKFRVTVLETYTDSFSGWYPGQFIQFDDISTLFNGSKKKFSLTITQGGTKELINLRSNQNDLSVSNNLFVFVNDVLQVPGEAYTFSGSRITFTEAPKSGSTSTVLFFRGSDLDVEEIEPPKTIKEGDTIQIDENIYVDYDMPQFDRVVKTLVSTDVLETFPYASVGISTNADDIRPLNWTKQTQDRVINGVLYSKSRPGLKSRIIPIAKVIKDVSISDTRIYVDSAVPLFSEIDDDRGLSEELRDIVLVNNIEINSPIVEAVVSSASTISTINIINPGSGYKNIQNPIVSISSRFITRKDPINNWNYVGIQTNSTFKSISYGNGFVSVGSSGFNAVSYNGVSWNIANTIDSGFDFNTVTGYENYYYSAGNNAKVYSKVGLSTTGSWSLVSLFKFTQDILGRLVVQASSYNNKFNKIVYNHYIDTLVVVGDGGGLFSSVGIGTTSLYDRTITAQNLNSVSYNSSYFVSVGNIGDIIYSEDGIIWVNIINKPTLQNLNDVIWDGNKFVAVGNNGTILISTNASVWSLITGINISNNIKKIYYQNELYTIITNDGKFYFSLDLIYWIPRSITQIYSINEVTGINSGDDEVFVSVGSSGFISYSTSSINEAVAISTISGGQLQSITMTNGGFGYSPNKNIPIIVQSDFAEKENIFSIKAKGDYGIIKDLTVYSTGNVGFGTTSPAIVFTLKSENYNFTDPISLEYSPISTGDYFIISDSNVLCGHALTGITTSLGGMSNYPASKVGTALTTNYIDGIYKVEYASEPVSGIVTVRCLFAPIPAIGPDIIQINVGINTTGFYGRYSFGMIYDYQNRARETPKSFNVNKEFGLVGLQSGPAIYRTRGII